MKTRTLTIPDVILAVALSAVAAVMFFMLPRLVGLGGDNVEILSGDKPLATFSLHQDRTFEALGPLGKTTIRVYKGRARIVSSPCPHKTCIMMGDVGKEGGVIVCLPNEIVVRVGKERADGLDAVSR